MHEFLDLPIIHDQTNVLFVFILLLLSLANYILMVEILFLLLDQIISYGATQLKNVVKFYVPTWLIFTAPVIYS